MTLKSLQESHRQIAELTAVLGALVPDRSLCRTDLTCELFSRFVGNVKRHFQLQEKELFPCLLRHADTRYNRAANRAMQAHLGIKRIFDDYLHTWCKNGVLNPSAEQDAFVRDTQEIFRLVKKRLDDDSRELHAMAREVLSDPPPSGKPHFQPRMQAPHALRHA